MKQTSLLRCYFLLMYFLIWIASCPVWSYQNYPNPHMYQLHNSQNLNNIRMQHHKENHLWQTLNSIDPNLGLNKPKRNAKDFATIKNSPKNVTRKMVLNVEYQCSKPQVIALVIDGYEDDDKLFRNSTNSHLVNDPEVFYQHAWSCDYTDVPKETAIKIKLPNRFLYRPSISMPKASQLEDVSLKIFLIPTDEWVFVSSQKELLRSKMQIMFEKSKIKLRLPLVMPPPFERPRIRRKKCLSWEAGLIAKILKTTPPKTVTEEECTELISHPAVMSEEPYGVISGFYPYYNIELQRLTKAKLRMTLTMEIYLFSYCESGRQCSLFQHINSDDQFESPVLLITQEGKLHLQVKVSNNNSYAHTSAWTVPARKWLRINYYQTNTLANVTVHFGKNFSEMHMFTAMFHLPLMFKDHSGYLTAGGSNYCKNINGIISYAKFCRNKALYEDQVAIPARPASISGKLLKAYQKQQITLRKSIKKRWKHYSDASKTRKDVCIPYFLELVQNATKCKNDSLENQTPATSEYNLMPTTLANVEEVLNELPLYLKSKDVLTQTKVALHKTFLKKLENASVLKNMTNALKYLKQAARLGDGVSHFFLFSIYKNGIGMEKNLFKAKFHLLLGAHLGDNLCLKTLAYSHLYGLCGFPSDINLAFFYYLNLAHKTQKDLLEHSEGQTSVNLARLTDEQQMKAQLSEGDDLFEWIKLQAAKGAYSAQRNMGRLLYWGQQGLQRNLEAAFKYYEEAAKGGDPVAMYDYGLVLIKGHGTEADTAKGIEILQQAADVQNPGAMNTLGWYYATEEANMTKAVEYFEKADKLGSIDAAYNLGYMHHTGKYPGKERDMKLAFTKYYRAASGGHIESALQVSQLTATGIENFVPRNPQAAVHWAKYLSEKNPTMGEIIREGLQAYRKRQWAKALFIYLSVAETGFEVAQYNTAFLCEADDGDVVKHIREECVWRNWNASAMIRNPHPYALNKMGDFHYYGHGGAANLNQAIRFYGLASKLKFPQALFNLASIMEEHGNVVKEEMLKELELPEAAFQSTDDAIVHLYRNYAVAATPSSSREINSQDYKCTDVDTTETTLPCYIALMRTQTKLMWMRTSLVAKVVTFFVVVLTTFIIIVINLHRRRVRLEQIRNRIHRETRLENGTFPNSLINNVENIAQTDNNTDDPFIVREEP